MPPKSETIPISAVGANVTKVQQMLTASASSNSVTVHFQEPGTCRVFVALAQRLHRGG